LNSGHGAWSSCSESGLSVSARTSDRRRRQWKGRRSLELQLRGLLLGYNHDHHLSNQDFSFQELIRVCTKRASSHRNDSCSHDALDSLMHAPRYALLALRSAQQAGADLCSFNDAYVPLPHFALFFAASASLLVASSSSAVSTAPDGRCTYRTTEPRMNMSFVEHYSSPLALNLQRMQLHCHHPSQS